MKVIVFGSKGLVGSSLVRVLKQSIKVSELIESNRSNLDLFNSINVRDFMLDTKPDIIVNAAAKVGGIYANDTKRTQFILENLKINMNILEPCIELPKTKVINLGSSCIYPLNSKNPISEDEFMRGKLEPTNSPYAMAKLTAIEIGRSISKQYGNKIINLMPTNLYGPNDYFSDMDSHVIPALIHRMYKSKLNNEETFKVWGTGKPLREFLYVDDLSNFIERILDENQDLDLLNVGSGIEVSIKTLSHQIKDILKFEGEIIFDNSLPDGNPRKFLDSTKLKNIGWNDFTNLEVGLNETINWYLNNLTSNRVVS